MPFKNLQARRRYMAEYMRKRRQTNRDLQNRQLAPAFDPERPCTYDILKIDVEWCPVVIQPIIQGYAIFHRSSKKYMGTL